MIPMRKIWERIGTVSTARHVPIKAAVGKIAEAEQAARGNENSRKATKELYVLYFLAGQLDDASKVAERWSEKEALDADALTARADMAASHGRRDEAIRILGSVVDVRPGDVPSQRRLARLHRWAGRAALGCRHAMALSQLREADAKLLSEAVYCARQTGESRLATDMLSAADDKVRKAAEAALAKRKPDEDKLRGEVRIEATWLGSGHDLDLALLHPDGHRVSWLGAPTKAIITATDVQSLSAEGLALQGAKAGEYVIEIVRASGDGPVRGELTIRAAGATRKIPFDLTSGQTRMALGLVNLRWQSRLVPM
jgi:tetratricopeptide (TPR) repeat protein